MSVVDGSVQADVVALDGLARGFAACGSELAGVAGGVDRAIPPVPEDEHGVGRRVVELDELRERLDRVTADAFAAVERRLAAVAAGAVRADQAPLLGPPS